MKKKSKYIGELGEYKVYNEYGVFIALDSFNKLIITGDTYSEVFDELAYIIAEKETSEFSG
jgi:hypothetical protein